MLHKALAKKWRKVSILTGKMQNNPSNFKMYSKVKIKGNCWDWNRYLVLQSLVILLSVPWEALDFFRKVSEILEIFSWREIRTRIYCLRSFRPHPCRRACSRKREKLKLQILFGSNLQLALSGA